MNGADAQGSALWSCHCLSHSGAVGRAGSHLQVKNSFSFGKGSPTGTRICQCLAALPLGAGPTPPHTSSRAVSSLPKLFEALLQQRGRHAQQPAHSSHVLAPRLLGLERLPAALPLQKMPPAPCSHPLITAWLLPCHAAGPAAVRSVLQQRACSPPVPAHEAGQHRGPACRGRLCAAAAAASACLC